MGSKYFKYRSTWIIYVLGIIDLLIVVPSLTIDSIHTNSAYLIPNLVVHSISVLVSVFVGATWIVQKENARYSLTVGILLAFLTMVILLWFARTIVSYTINF